MFWLMKINISYLYSYWTNNLWWRHADEWLLLGLIGPRCRRTPWWYQSRLSPSRYVKPDCLQANFIQAKWLFEDNWLFLRKLFQRHSVSKPIRTKGFLILSKQLTKDYPIWLYICWKLWKNYKEYLLAEFKFHFYLLIYKFNWKPHAFQYSTPG